MRGRSSLTGFLPPGRRKKWREVCIDKLANSVELKMEGNKLEGRGEIKMRLVRHLEVIQMLMLKKDLRIVKHHWVVFIPPR